MWNVKERESTGLAMACGVASEGEGLGFGLCCGRDKKKKKKKLLNFTCIRTMSYIEYLLTFFFFFLPIVFSPIRLRKGTFDFD